MRGAGREHLQLCAARLAIAAAAGRRSRRGRPAGRQPGAMRGAEPCAGAGRRSLAISSSNQLLKLAALQVLLTNLPLVAATGTAAAGASTPQRLIIDTDMSTGERPPRAAARP